MRRVLCLSLVLILCVSLIGCGANNHDGEVKTPVESSELEGRNYEEVVKIFEEKGFTNIKTEAIHDLVVDCLKEDQAVDAHALVRLVKNGEAFACVCVDTNLYMFCKKKNDEEQIEGWIDYENGQYRWKYICPPNYSKVKYPIKDKLPLQEEIAIDLTAVLKDITEEL